MKKNDQLRCRATLAIGLLTFAVAMVANAQTYQSQPATVGYRDFNFDDGGVTDEPTQEKPESKLWYHDSYWWGVLWDPNPARHTYRIHRFDPATQNWTNVGPDVDSRPNSSADALWDGGHLYITSRAKENHTAAEGLDLAILNRYTYDSEADSFSLDSGFPVDITGTEKTRALVMTKDSSGQLWVTWTANRKVMVNHTVASDSNWGTPFVLPVQGSDIRDIDLASVTAFGGDKIGVLWSNQEDEKYYFATHVDSKSDSLWEPREEALADPSFSPVADDHINLAVSPTTGTVLAVVKTSSHGEDSPKVVVLKRAPTVGNWSYHTYGLGRDKHTRPIVLVDSETDNVYVFARQKDLNAIVVKSAHVDDLSFPTGIGTPFILSEPDDELNNPTSTKQPINSQSGILVLAGDKKTEYYLHNHSGLPLQMNFAPIAQDDDYSIDEDDSLDVASPGVCENDNDVNGDSLLVSLIDSTLNGALAFNSDGAFSYLPEPQFNGTDSFRYELYDGRGGRDTATVNLTVRSVNDNPLVTEDAYNVVEDSVLTAPAPGVLGNDTDVEDDSLTAVVGTLPANGILQLGRNGSFTYTPNQDFSGIDTFVYWAIDGQAGSSDAMVTISVSNENDPPITTSDVYAIFEDSLLTVPPPGVLGNDTEVDGDTLVATAAVEPAFGTFALNPDGSFRYLPQQNFSGRDTLSYVASDGKGGTSKASVTIDVQPVNDDPVVVADAYNVPEDNILTVLAPGVLGNDSDVENDILTAALARTPTNGTVALLQDGSLVYTPRANFNGVDSFEYTSSDGRGGSATTTVTISVTSENDVPVAVNDNYEVDEDNTLTVPAPGLISNDSDPDGNTLSVSLATTAQKGDVTLSVDGSLTYVPQRDFNGTDTFSYTAMDENGSAASANVSIAVRPTNDEPVARPDFFNVGEDLLLTVSAPGLLDNDSDVDGDNLTATLETESPNGVATINQDGSITYQPNIDFNGRDSFSYRVDDGNGGSASATVTISVDATNDAPVAVADTFRIDEDNILSVTPSGVLDNDVDPDGDFLNTAVATEPVNGALTLALDGSFTYTPEPDFNGLDSFTYTARDNNGGVALGSVTVIVVPVNDPPIVTEDAFSTDEDSSLTVLVPGVLANDADVDGDSLVAELEDQPASGNVSLNAAGSFVYKPSLNFNGTDGFSYKAKDPKGGTASTTVTIKVKPQNDAPAVLDDSFDIPEDGTLTVSSPGLLRNDYDPEDDPLSTSLVSDPQNGILQLSADGSFTYKPGHNFNGTDSFIYSAEDEQRSAGEGTVTINVIALNDPPIANDDTYTVKAGGNLVESAPGIMENDRDAEGDALTAAVLKLPARGHLLLEPDGSFTYTPAGAFAGMDHFTYIVTDSNGASSASATVSVDILENDPGGSVEPDSTEWVFPPTDDAVIAFSVPDENFGYSTEAHCERDRTVSYFKFSVTSLPDTLSRVHLRLFVTDGTTSNLNIYSVSNNFRDSSAPWRESELVANNAPEVGGPATGPTATVLAGSSVDFDVTQAISVAGVYSFALKMDGNDRVTFSTKEGAHPPELIIAATADSGSGTTDSEGDVISVGDGSVPEKLILSPNYPNPFNAETTIEFALPSAAKVRLTIYNTRGQQVRQLVQALLQPGFKKLIWDGKNDTGSDVGAGIYFLRLSVGNQHSARKIILQK